MRGVEGERVDQSFCGDEARSSSSSSDRRSDGNTSLSRMNGQRYVARSRDESEHVDIASGQQSSRVSVFTD